VSKFKQILDVANERGDAVDYDDLSPDTPDTQLKNKKGAAKKTSSDAYLDSTQQNSKPDTTQTVEKLQLGVKFDNTQQFTSPQSTTLDDGNLRLLAQPAVKQGRPKAKRSDPNYIQVTAYIRKETHATAKIELLKDGQTGEKREFSELVQDLLNEWLKSRT
jgi:hypothetical protein